MRPISKNPKGIPPQSPGLPSLRGYPGVEASEIYNPNDGVAPNGASSVRGELPFASHLHWNMNCLQKLRRSAMSIATNAHRIYFKLRQERHLCSRRPRNSIQAPSERHPIASIGSGIFCSTLHGESQCWIRATKTRAINY
jgi:hypothetical protein